MNQPRQPQGQPTGGQFATVERSEAEVTLDQYVWVEGGLVQNSPALPIIDVDFIKDFATEASVEDALETRRIAASLGLADTVRRIDNWLTSDGLLPDAETLDPVNDVEADSGSYIFVEGGLVQNDPSIPVIDTDFMDDGDESDIANAPNLIAVAEASGATALAQDIRDWLTNISTEE